MPVMFTNIQKASEANREVGYRQFVYSKKVAEGSMKQDVAERRIAIMQEIADHFLALAEADEPKLL
jgi:hypothetical protein